jgi:DNA-binding transcriptional LysR family regulator
MQFESLKVFCDIARFRSFSQAATANEITQSAASQIALQLEKRMGVQLINRSTRPLQLTPLGKTYYDGCKALVEQYLELEASIRQAQAQMDASLRVTAIYSVGLGDMGQLVERFMALHPNTRVHLEYLHPRRVYEKVLEGSADLGLVSFPRRSRELVQLPWREEPMVLACPPGHPLAHQRTIRSEQLNGEKYIGFDRDLVIRKHVDRFLREQGVSVEVALEFDNIETIKKAIEVSAGVALLPEPTFRREVQAGTLKAVPLTGAQLVRPLGIIHRRHHRLSASAQRFIELLQESQENGLSNDGKSESSAGRNGPQPRVNGTPRGHRGATSASKRTVVT